MTDSILSITDLPQLKQPGLEFQARTLLDSALEVYHKAPETLPGDARVRLHLAIILLESGREGEGREALDQVVEMLTPAGSGPGYGPPPAEAEFLATVLLVQNLYSGAMTPTDVPGQGSGLIARHLSDWYRDRVLTQLYGRLGNAAQLERVQEIAAARAARTLVYLMAASGVVFLLVIISLGLWGAFLFGSRHLLVRSSTPKAAWSLLAGWGVFMTWELLRLAAAIALGLLFLSRAQLPIGLLLGIQLPVYAVIIYLIFRGLSRVGQTPAALGLGSEQLGRQILGGLMGYLMSIPLMIVVTLVSMRLIPLPPQSDNPVFELLLGRPHSPPVLVMLFLLVGVLGPLFEELLFRGWLQGALRSRFSAAATVLLVSLIFALVHIDPPGLVRLFTLGLALSYLRERTGSLVPSIVLHCCWNSITFLLVMLL